MVDITLNREVGRTYNLDLRENSVNYEVQLDAQRRNFIMSDSCYGYYYAGPQHFTQRIEGNPDWELVEIYQTRYDQFMAS